MTNKELGEFISSEEFQETSTDLIKHTESIIGAGADIVTSYFFGIPCYTLLKPFIDGLSDWRNRVELKQLAYFLIEFKNLSQSERSDFSLMIQGNEEDFTEKLFYYISMLNDKKKAAICGKVGVAFARKIIPEKYFLKIVSAINRTDYYTLLELRRFYFKSFIDIKYPTILKELPFEADIRGITPPSIDNLEGLKPQLIASGLYYELTPTGILSKLGETKGYLVPEAHFICIYGFELKEKAL